MTDIEVPFGLDQVTTFLRSAPIVLHDLIGALPDKAIASHPRAGAWCIKEVVGHLTEEDKRDFVGRIRLMLEQDEPCLPINDQDEVSRMRRDCDKDVSDLLDEFSTVRAASVSFLSLLKESDLRRAGIHARAGRLQVTNLLHEWIYHDLSHISQIRANVQSYLRPHLGNLQQFYQPR